MQIREYLRELAAAGMSDAEIGREIDAPQSIVTRLRNGRHQSTSFVRGERIVALWRARVCTPTSTVQEKEHA